MHEQERFNRSQQNLISVSSVISCSTSGTGYYAVIGSVRAVWGSVDRACPVGAGRGTTINVGMSRALSIGAGRGPAVGVRVGRPFAVFTRSFTPVGVRVSRTSAVVV